MKQISIIFFALFFLTACDYLDPYAVKFNNLTVTNSKQSVINMMGEQPDSIATFELPGDMFLPKIEQLSWKTRLANRIYVTIFVSERLLAKVVI